MTDLIVGGTSGLGLEIAKDFVVHGTESVIVTGRHDPEVEGIEFRHLDLSQPELPKKIGQFVTDLPDVSNFVYAAGYFQEGRITDLSDDQIEEMIDVGGRSLVYLTKSLLKKQVQFGGLITITSTSQWTPRKLEPVYNFVKAAAAHFSNAVAEDGRVDKVLVAGPAGMNTDFWEGVERDDKDTMMDPAWVAEQVMDQWQDSYEYRFVKILRDPPRVEIVEER